MHLVTLGLAQLVTLAVQAPAAPPSYDELAALAAGVRPWTVLVEGRTGAFTAVVLDERTGTLGTSRTRLERAGELAAYGFRPGTERPDRPDRVSLGPVRAVTIHRSADAALLRLEKPEGLARAPAGGTLATGTELVVLGGPGEQRLEDMVDLEARSGSVLSDQPLEGALPMSAPVHLTNSGGPVVDRAGHFLALAVPGSGPAGTCGRALPPERLGELIPEDSPQRQPPEALARWLAPADDGLPPYLHRSPQPGGPTGKRVDFGGGVWAIKDSRTVLVAGLTVLDRHDALEYLVCPLKNGKLHETVMACDADPATINLAMVALGYASGGGVERLGDPATPFGDKVRMYLEWDSNEASAIAAHLRSIEPAWQRPNYATVRERKGEGLIRWQPGLVVRVHLEDLAFDCQDGTPMERTDWVFTGSRVRKDPETEKRYFAASAEGVLAAVYRDPVAVFNITLKTAQDDTVYVVRDTLVPPRGTSCLLIIEPAPAAP